LPAASAPPLLQCARGVSNGPRGLGYATLLVSEGDGAAALRRLSTTRMVDGFVLLNVGESDERLDVLRQAAQPGSLIGLPADPEGLDVFDLDFPASGRLMVEQLHGVGHREAILVSQ